MAELPFVFGSLLLLLLLLVLLLLLLLLLLQASLDHQGQRESAARRVLRGLRGRRVTRGVMARMGNRALKVRQSNGTMLRAATHATRGTHTSKLLLAPTRAAGPMGPAGPPLLFCPFQVQWKVAVGTCSEGGHATAVAHCPDDTFLMSSACAGYEKGSNPGTSPAVSLGPMRRLHEHSLL
jgi:hypothetical protein